MKLELAAEAREAARNFYLLCFLHSGALVTN